MGPMTYTTTSSAAAAIEFEPEFVAGVKTLFEEKISFNRVLGLKITSLKPERVTGCITMSDHLVGYYAHNRLHGGVISAGLDAMGGLAVRVIGVRHQFRCGASHRALRASRRLGEFGL